MPHLIELLSFVVSLFSSSFSAKVSEILFSLGKGVGNYFLFFFGKQLHAFEILSRELATVLESGRWIIACMSREPWLAGLERPNVGPCQELLSFPLTTWVCLCRKSMLLADMTVKLSLAYRSDMSTVVPLC